VPGGARAARFLALSMPLTRGGAGANFGLSKGASFLVLPTVDLERTDTLSVSLLRLVWISLVGRFSVDIVLDRRFKVGFGDEKFPKKSSFSVAWGCWGCWG